MRINPTHAARLYLQGLASLHLRERVDEAMVDWVLQQSPPVEVTAGHIVLRQGDPADSALLIVHGELCATVHSEAGEREVGTAGAWDVVGETALFAPEQPRSATVRAVRDSTCLRVPRALLQQGRDNPVVAAIEYHLLHTLTHRLRTTNEGIEEALRRTPGHGAAAHLGGAL